MSKTKQSYFAIYFNLVFDTRFEVLEGFTFYILGVYSIDILHNLLNVVICKLASSMNVTNVKLVTYFIKYVTSQEFVLAKQTLKSDKTCGIDGLINEFFK